MKVECIKIINPVNGEEEVQSNWLTIGRTYIVLTLSSIPGRGLLLRVISDDNRTPILAALRQFKTVSSKIPLNWVAVVNEQGSFELSPQRWLRAGFWEDYFNGLPQALKEFEEEMEKLSLEF